MKTFFAIVVLLAAGIGAWTWGDRQAQELAEWRRVWGEVYALATGGDEMPEGASVESLGRTVAREFEAAKRGGADIRTSVGELEEKLAAATKRATAAEGELAALKREMEERVEASVADLRAELAAGIETARTEVAQAKAERAEAVKALAVAETRLADVEATLEAVINVPGDSMRLGEGEEEEELEEADNPESPENPEKPEIPEEPEAAAEPEEPEEPVEAGAGEETPEETPEEAVVAGRVIGASGLFLTLTYSEEARTLRLQFRGGEELTYAGVPAEVAAALRESGDKVDQEVRKRVKGKFEAAGDEEGVWKGYRRGGKKGKKGASGRLEALWVSED